MSNYFSALDSDDEGHASTVPAVSTSKPTRAATGGVKVPVAPGGEMRATDGPAGGRARSNRTRGGARGGRGGRGGRGRGGDRPRRGREYDRRSGTGYGTEVKKDGAGGKYTWGTDGDEARAAADAVAEAREGASAPAEVVEEEPDNTMTLDQFLAARAGQRTGDAFAAKEAAEVDTSGLKGKKVAPKAQREGEVFTETTRTARRRERERSTKAGAVLTNVGFRVGGNPRDDRPPRRDRDDRPAGRGRGGGRGGARGGSRGGARGGGRGGARGGSRGGARAPNVNDKNAFPTLG